PRPLKDAVHEFKVEFILGVLKTTGGVQKAAAEILEIQPTYLSRLLSQLRSPRSVRSDRRDAGLNEPSRSGTEDYGTHKSHRF
ncbi:MAG: hypothetical protein OEV30_10205, partial [Ignavibacteria bacterium]|nr:hypothetical protein [Ignavibacteria bacterium]